MWLRQPFAFRLSCQTVLAATGDLTAADDLEIVAYNSLPATLAKDGRGMRYYCLLNQPTCEDKPLLFANNGAGSGPNRNGAICPGPHAGFGCCRSNFHFAWPKFVQSLTAGNLDSRKYDAIKGCRRKVVTPAKREQNQKIKSPRWRRRGCRTIDRSAK